MRLPALLAVGNAGWLMVVVLAVGMRGWTTFPTLPHAMATWSVGYWFAW